ncbi:MAG: MazG nucleotide pyrophosphohydrolase domain-containing protein, partial [Gammaproteobacteria bacterium]
MDITKMQKSDHDNFDVLNEVNLLQQDAINFGFNWPNMDMLIEQIISECKEIEQAHHDNESKDRIQEEIGDLLHAVMSLCIFNGFDITQTILKNNDKYNRRLKALKIITK